MLGSWNSLDPIRRRNGHVPCGGVNLLDHADQMLVKPSFPEVHQKTSSRVFSWHLLKNDQGTILQTHQQPHNNKHDGFNCWQLVFVADGIN
jgi:hypothetical protein